MGQLKDEIDKKSEQLLKKFLDEYPNVGLLKQGRFHKELVLEVGDYVVTPDKVLVKATGKEICVQIDETKTHLLTDIDKMIAKTLVILNAPGEIITLRQDEEETDELDSNDPDDNPYYWSDKTIYTTADLQKSYRQLTKGKIFPPFIFLPAVRREFVHDTINKLHEKGYEFLSFIPFGDRDSVLGVLLKLRKNFNQHEKQGGREG